MKAWKTSDFFNYHSESLNTFDDRIKHTCKLCGYTTPERQTCGSFSEGQHKKEDKAEEEMLVDHIMKYHRDKLDIQQ
jgi:hypothetical protein